MLKFIADEDFDNHILRGLLRRRANMDIIRVQDTPLAGAQDPDILRWAAQEQRVLLTHDVSTMTKHAYERIYNKEPLAGTRQLGRPHL
jgi:predicted nuclease of predicted toxin-antitoxin system